MTRQGVGMLTTLIQIPESCHTDQISLQFKSYSDSHTLNLELELTCLHSYWWRPPPPNLTGAELAAGYLQLIYSQPHMVPLREP